MSAAEHLQPSATQSANDITSHNDVTKTVSGSGKPKSLHRSTSDAYPAVGGGPRTRDDRRSPTSGARRGKGISKPVAVTHSAPDAAASAVAPSNTAAPSRPVDPHQNDRAPNGDDQQSSDSDDYLKKESLHERKKKQTTSSRKRQVAGESQCCADTTSNSVVVVEPQIVSPRSAFAPSGYGKTAESSENTASTSESSRGTESQKEPRGYETNLTNSRRRRTGDDDPGGPKVKSEGKHKRCVVCSFVC